MLAGGPRHVAHIEWTRRGIWQGGEVGIGRGAGEALLPRRSSSWAQTVRTQISLFTTYMRRRLGKGTARGGLRTWPLGEPGPSLALQCHPHRGALLWGSLAPDSTLLAAARLPGPTHL